MKLAIVEDEVILTMALSLLLEGWGHEVVGTADDEPGALALVRATRPDAVLMDIRLGPQQSGLRAAQAIRGESKIPIVFCTAGADDALLQAEVKLLPDAHLVAKPVDENELAALLRLIERCVRRSESAAA